MKVLRGIGLLLLGGVVLLAGVAALARFSDGPIAVFPGGPLESGAWVAEPVADWSFVRKVGEIELQLLEPARSRITWIVAHQGSAYVPCGFLDVPLWKQWPHQARADGRAIVRIQGRRYPVTLERVEDPELFQALSGEAADKYGFGSEGPADPDAVWFFRLAPRPAPPPNA